MDTSPANLLIDGDGPIGLSAEELETLAQLKRSFSDMPAGTTIAGGVSCLGTSPANLLIDGDGPIGLSAEELETLAQLKRSFSDMPAGAEKAGGASGRAEEDLRI